MYAIFVMVILHYSAHLHGTALSYLADESSCARRNWSWSYTRTFGLGLAALVLGLVLVLTFWSCFHHWCTADFEARRRLRSTSSLSLTVHRTRLSTFGDWDFSVAAARTWNRLPHATCHVRTLYVVSEDDLRLSFPDVPSHDSLPQLL